MEYLLKRGRVIKVITLNIYADALYIYNEAEGGRTSSSYVLFEAVAIFSPLLLSSLQALVVLFLVFQQRPTRWPITSLLLVFCVELWFSLLLPQ